MTVVALLSPGAMGAALGARLVANGATVLTALAGRGPATVARAQAAGMRDAPDAALAEADIILSVVPPAEAAGIVQRLLPYLAGHRPLFADMNALAPATKRSLADVVERTGARFVDGAIIGSPPGEGRADPVLYMAGAAAVETRVLASLGLDIRPLAGAVGAAAALKMCYAGINKGLVGLAAAMLVAADRAGAAAALHDEMNRSMPDLARRFARQLPDMRPKAGRWVAEMREIGAFADEVPGARAIFDGMAELYGHVADAVRGDDPEGTCAALDRAVAALGR